VNPEQLEVLCRQVLDRYPNHAEKFRQGKPGVLGFLVGQAIVGTGGRVPAKQASDLFVKLLSPRA
jgi:Asp-tRNA(Asn)/Glu-tRNA(Gln) amidotransferase B subunit